MKKNGITKRFLKSAATAACVVCAGCDIELPSLKTATEKVAEYSEQQMPRDPPPPAVTRADEARAELAHYVSSRLKILEADISQAEKNLSAVHADRDILAKRISELSGKVFADKDAKRENALLALLKDPELNSLAVKYTGADFSLACNGLVSGVRHAYEQQKRKEEALSENLKEFEQAVGSEDARNARAEDARNAEMRQLEKKIAEAERRLRYLRLSIITSAQARRDRDREISICESELNVQKRRVLQLRSQVTGRSVSFVRSQAQLRLDNANRDVERRFKDEITAFEVAEVCEKNTVKKLEEAVISAEKIASDRLYLFRRQKLFVSSISSGTEKLDASAVAEVRDEVSKILSWSVEDAKKGGVDGGKR